MNKAKSTLKITKLTVELINENIIRHTIQFFYKADKELRPFGSGVLALIYDNYFILTCSHVADYFEKENVNLFIRVDKKRYINVIGEIKYTDIDKSKGIDLAYIKVDEQMLPELLKPYRPITIDKFRNHNQMLDGMNYCVLGFPEKNIKFENGTMDTGASFYLTSATNENPYNFYRLDKNDFFIVEMKGKGTDVKNGQSTIVNGDFYGISGGGLWFLSYNSDENMNVHSIDYKLIGIMTEFKKGKYYCLIANKIHLILEALTVIEGYEFRQKLK
jgi:hypothetical protein